MDGLVQFSIPVKGLRRGPHRYDFQLDALFFAHFEGSPIDRAAIEVGLELDKRADMYILEFDLRGVVRVECDRCLAEIDLPVASRQRLLVKISETEELEDADVAYISPEAHQLNVAKYMYEYAILALPLIKTYECRASAPYPCNEEMLRYLSANGEAGEDGEKLEDNPMWESLKKLSKDNSGK
jgi:uncharacterized metal-binding protein YceD (DUF177 family)